MLSAKRLVNMPTRARRYTTHKRACRHVCKPYAIQPVVKERSFSTVRKEAVLHYTCPILKFLCDMFARQTDIGYSVLNSISMMLPSTFSPSE